MDAGPRMLVRAGPLTALLLSWKIFCREIVALSFPLLGIGLLPNGFCVQPKRALIIDLNVATAAALMVIYGT
jgi:hypothetical protein